MKGFGFPGSSGGSNTPYRADTSAKKSELINILTRSEKLWNEEGKQEESLVQLRKAISILEFIVANEAIESVKTAYEEKLKELRGRLKDREQNKEQVPSTHCITQHTLGEEEEAMVRREDQVETRTTS